MIFAIIGAILIILLLIGLISMKGSSRKRGHIKNASGSFKIWTVGDKESKINEVITHFKEKNRGYSSIQYEVVSFPNFEEYQEALTSAFIKGEAPDLFVLNNNEKSVFEDKVLAIPNNIINPNNFRKNYEGVFIDDLILKSEEKNDDGEFSEALKGLPVGYETLGVFYNKRRGFRANDFTSFAQLRRAMNRIKKPGLIPIAIGNGSTVSNTSDILAHLYLLKKVHSLKEANSAKNQTVLYDYTKFGSIEGTNGYNGLFANAITNGNTDIDLFKDEEIGAIVGYPRLVLKLQAKGFSRRLIYAQPFPHKSTTDGPTFVNYNYFVVNSDTQQENTAFAFLKYLNTNNGAKLFLDKFRYYLPAKVDLKEELAERKISNFFEGIILKDFYSLEHELASFDKGNKVIYDKGVNDVLDNFSGYGDEYDNFRKKVLCKFDKILNLKNLSVSCK